MYFIKGKIKLILHIEVDNEVYYPNINNEKYTSSSYFIYAQETE